ncbi:MAG: NAD-dependent epimerase/dehydratase family protein [Burkholderiaceae bacterium]
MTQEARKKVLVIGGTGPTGPHIVNGLIQRGHEVVILHGGQHEVEFVQEIEHIHTDPHFAETLSPALAGRTFDLVIATYGRLRIIADVLKGKTQRLVGVSGAAVFADRSDPRWGGLGRPILIREDGPRHESESRSAFGNRMWATEETLMKAHREGHFAATIVRYPLVFGPNAPANPDWSTVRRILDGRRRIIASTNGTMGRRGYAENVAHAMLLVADHPELSAGQIYNLRDESQFSQRQRIEFIAGLLGREIEIVELPPELADRAGKPESVLEFDICKIQSQLGYRDLVSPKEALTRSINWLIENPLQRGGEVEQQLGDPFAYDAEDRLIDAYQAAMAEARAIEFPKMQSGHMYRHPKKPGEAWKPHGAREQGKG